VIDWLWVNLPRREDATFWISILSFVTSTALAIAKGVEFFGERRISIKVESRFVGLEEYGNEIILLNKSAIPITISYYELVWTVPRRIFGIKVPFTHKIEADASPEDPMSGCNIKIESHETHALTFRDEYHFDWGPSIKETIYLKLWIVGHQKRPRWFYITGPKR
jgi:hypothetical protein